MAKRRSIRQLKPKTPRAPTRRRPTSNRMTAIALALTRQPLSSWDDFMWAAGDTLDGSWLVRGVSRTSFSLTPSVGRGPHPAAPLRISEQRLLDRFRSDVRPCPSFQPTDVWERLAIAQHKGVPTRLIDRSDTPLVAAYFAVGDHDDSSWGEDFGRQPHASGAETAESSFSVPDVRYFSSIHVARRIVASRPLHGALGSRSRLPTTASFHPLRAGRRQ